MSAAEKRYITVERHACLGYSIADRSTRVSRPFRRSNRSSSLTLMFLRTPTQRQASSPSSCIAPLTQAGHAGLLLFRVTMLPLLAPLYKGAHSQFGPWAATSRLTSPLIAGCVFLIVLVTSRCRAAIAPCCARHAHISPRRAAVGAESRRSCKRAGWD